VKLDALKLEAAQTGLTAAERLRLRRLRKEERARIRHALNQEALDAKWRQNRRLLAQVKDLALGFFAHESETSIVESDEDDRLSSL
jgi:hypothetical protein